jgi:hypothetical protein
MTSFGREVKPSAPCRKILQHIKDPCGAWQRYFVGKIYVLFRQVSSASLLGVCCNQTVLVDGWGMIRTYGETQYIRKCPQCMGRCCNSNQCAFCPVLKCENNVCVCIYIYIYIKLSHYTPWRRLGDRRYSSYSYSTSALDGGEWSASLLGRTLAPGKGSPVPIVQEAGWAPELVWTKRL